MPDSTAAGVSQSSPLEEQQAAGKAITAELAAINSAVVQATSQVQGIHKHAMSLKNSTIATRQTVDLDIDLAPLVTNLLLEVSGTLDNVISSLGLPATLSLDLSSAAWVDFSRLLKSLLTSCLPLSSSFLTAFSPVSLRVSPVLLCKGLSMLPVVPHVKIFRNNI